jgi:hypothetical protein
MFLIDEDAHGSLNQVNEGCLDSCLPSYSAFGTDMVQVVDLAWLEIRRCWAILLTRGARTVLVSSLLFAWALCRQPGWNQ